MVCLRSASPVLLLSSTAVVIVLARLVQSFPNCTYFPGQRVRKVLAATGVMRCCEIETLTPQFQMP